CRRLARLAQRELQYQQRRSSRMAHAVAGNCRRARHAAGSAAADVARAGNAEARGRMGGDRAQVPAALAAEPGAVRRPVLYLHRPQFCLRAIRIAGADAGEHGEGAPRRIPRLRRHRGDVPAPLRPAAGAALATPAQLIARQLAVRPDAAALRSTACEDQRSGRAEKKTLHSPSPRRWPRSASGISSSNPSKAPDSALPSLSRNRLRETPPPSAPSET